MPFPQYTSVGTGSENDPVGNARFNSLQVKATKRYSNGFTLLAFWTWMKNMSTLQSNQYTPYRPITYSGDSPPHTFVINASYDLPFGPKRKFLNSVNPRSGGRSWAAGTWPDTPAIPTVPRLVSAPPTIFRRLGYGAKFANYVAGVPIFGMTNPRDFDPAVDPLFRPGRRFRHSPAV